MKTLKEVNDGVELWCIEHPVDPETRAYIIKDPRRTPETWAFGSIAEARAKFDEVVANAKNTPMLR